MAPASMQAEAELWGLWEVLAAFSQVPWEEV